VNVGLVRYHLGPLATAENVSAPCAAARAVLLDEQLDDQGRLERVLEVLTLQTALDAQTLTLLERGIRGHVGGEGYQLDVSQEAEAVFWHGLASAFPQHAALHRIAGDAAYLADGRLSERALAGLERAVTLAPQEAFKLDGGLCDELFALPSRPYVLALVRNAIEDDPDDVQELVQEIRQAHPDHPELDAAVEAVLGGG
jgi:hypothetical protein